MEALQNKSLFFMWFLSFFLSFHKLFEVVQNAMVYVVSHIFKLLRVTAKSLSLQPIFISYQLLTNF
jgi:hypothetical protein